MSRSSSQLRVGRVLFDTDLQPVGAPVVYRRPTRAILLVVLGLIAPVPARAQESKSDGDPVMQPTQLGMSLTPDLADSLGKYWVSQHLAWKLSLTREQFTQVSEAMADSMLGHLKNHPDHGRRILEFILEAEMGPSPRFDPESGQAFAERHEWMPEASREIYADIHKRTRPLLDPQQREIFDDWYRDQQRWVNRFEAKLDRWAQGGAEPGERLFKWKESDLEADPEPQDEKPLTVKRARRVANYQLRELSISSWVNFLNATEAWLEFTPEQSAKANALLAHYREQADTIMTEAWWQAARRNRMERYLCRTLRQKGPTQPWEHRLETEFRELVGPVLDLGRQFREGVLALATDEQLSVLTDDLREMAEQYDLDKTMLEHLTRQLQELARRARPVATEAAP